MTLSGGRFEIRGPNDVSGASRSSDESNCSAKIPLQFFALSPLLVLRGRVRVGVRTPILCRLPRLCPRRLPPSHLTARSIPADPSVSTPWLPPTVGPRRRRELITTLRRATSEPAGHDEAHYATMVGDAGAVSNGVSVPAESSACRRWISKVMSCTCRPAF